MKKLGFVIPWFSETIPGGAEMELREVTSHLHAAGVQLEILTTCVREFSSDWSRNYYSEGVTCTSEGIPVRRFRVRKRDREAFDAVNAKLLLGADVSIDDEKTFLREMVNSPALYKYISENESNYSLFVFIPYMFGTTFGGMRACLKKAVMIPCFHDEAYAYLKGFKKLFPRAAGMIFNSAPEAELAERLYGISSSGTRSIVMGIGMDTDIVSEPEKFREKYDINEPFILYAGRKEAGKNVDRLVSYFSEYIKHDATGLRLVLIGGGNIALPEELVKSGRILDLGFVSKQDKYNALGAAEFLCQPSDHESFSLVIMESWLCGRPVLVSERCEVTRRFASDSNGGLWFSSYEEFSACTDLIMQKHDIAAAMGHNGCEYVRNNFSWDVIVRKYMDFFRQLNKEIRASQH